MGESIEFRLGAGDEDDVEALGGQLEREFFAEPIGCAGHDGPGALLAVPAELIKEGEVSPLDTSRQSIRISNTNLHLFRREGKCAAQTGE